MSLLLEIRWFCESILSVIISFFLFPLLQIEVLLLALYSLYDEVLEKKLCCGMTTTFLSNSWFQCHGCCFDVEKKLTLCFVRSFAQGIIFEIVEVFLSMCFESLYTMKIFAGVIKPLTELCWCKSKGTQNSPQKLPFPTWTNPGVQSQIRIPDWDNRPNILTFRDRRNQPKNRRRCCLQWYYLLLESGNNVAGGWRQYQSVAMRDLRRP